jgi:hypothetical protein
MSTTYGSKLAHDPALLAEALNDAKATPFWLDHPDRPVPRPALTEDIVVDLLIIGGGFCGLWTAIIAKERHPEWNVVLVEKQRIAWAASGRNGGFCESNLTHGDDNGRLHFPDELATIQKLANENFAELHRTISQYNIDAEWENTGVMVVATEKYQVPWITNSTAQQLNLTGNHGYGTSPVYRAALFKKHGYSFVHPAKLAWGLADVAEQLGVSIYENTEITDLNHNCHYATAHSPEGTITANKVALATNAFPSLLRHLRPFTLPIYDYAIVTEPLSGAQLEEIGWTERNGITDSGREFHYYRKTADNRILFGGWDAIYHRGRKITSRYDQRPETFTLLLDHLYTTFPSLIGTKISHAWGGVIDMSTQLVAFHGTTRNKTVAYSAGYTGLGLGATRFGAETMLDLIEGKETERTMLKMARRLPIPIPPEPIVYPLVQIMRRAVIKSDQNNGKDGLLLKLMGLFKIGFDS